VTLITTRHPTALPRVAQSNALVMVNALIAMALSNQVAQITPEVTTQSTY